MLPQSSDIAAQVLGFTQTALGAVLGGALVAWSAARRDRRTRTADHQREVRRAYAEWFSWVVAAVGDLEASALRRMDALRGSPDARSGIRPLRLSESSNFAHEARSYGLVVLLEDCLSCATHALSVRNQLSKVGVEEARFVQEVIGILKVGQHVDVPSREPQALEHMVALSQTVRECERMLGLKGLCSRARAEGGAHPESGVFVDALAPIDARGSGAETRDSLTP